MALLEPYIIFRKLGEIVSNSMNGLTEEESKKNIQKIISNVVKEVLIDKN